ncbi:MAG: S-adenosylmethionine:tRNA ribosyltransferase-isomerase [Acidimicrobiia bacterium]|nr:S-adenosylmethionine:tRNA ribosyltransferase-isomerase [Acidimicrobiia bacterium]
MTLLAERPTVDSLDFELPPALEAAEPAEVRGRGRDDVRLLVARRRGLHLAHARFWQLPEVLRAGDLVVVNTSATLPAAVPALRDDGTCVDVHVSTSLPAGLWLVELRQPRGPASVPFAGGTPGERLRLSGGAEVELFARWSGGDRLWVAGVDLPAGRDLVTYLHAEGHPIRYAHVTEAWPLSAYQTVYGTESGSAEMPSAGRAFTPEVFTALMTHGVTVAPLVLHTGVSSPEADEAPYPEPYRVPASTAALVNHTRARGNSVIAVGTTVVRALETVADETGAAHPGQGWTDLVVTPARGVRVVDGLLTGWHEPRASHLALVESVAGRDLLERSYEAAVGAGYRWHEFGDLHLVLP